LRGCRALNPTTLLGRRGQSLLRLPAPALIVAAISGTAQPIEEALAHGFERSKIARHPGAVGREYVARRAGWISFHR
jgi:hypothetical protein